MFPTNHKTMFVLDHTPYFGLSSDNPIDFDVAKSRGPGYVPLPPVCKSLWTCSVEAAVEYCRIVWDLFPEGKLMRFVVSDFAAHVLNTWSLSQQNFTHLLNSLCLVGPVRRGAGGDVVGLCAAIESLGEPTGAQAAIPAERLCQNRGRIICITSTRDDISIRSLIEIATNTLVLQNKKASEPQPATPDPTSPPIPLAITYCHLIVINVTPETAETRVNSQPLTQLAGGIMEVEVIACRASALANLLGRLVLPHYRLATTTVTGIPMKEEQNATSSANYDVEIIHSAEAHAGLRASQSKAEAEESVVLRWWTPRGAEGGAGGCHGPLWRVTPADAASRPSACLVNFLLNGRSVTLEVPSKKGGGRSASHVLAAQGGELWVGALGGRSPYDDPPALSEGPGGRVTDYRIKEFGALMQQNRLLPLRGSGATTRARSRLQRHTTYWPLTISSTLIFNMGAVMEPLTRLVVQESLTDEEVEQCRAVLLSLLGMESRHELPAPHLPAAARYHHALPHHTDRDDTIYCPPLLLQPMLLYDPQRQVECPSRGAVAAGVGRGGGAGEGARRLAAAPRAAAGAARHAHAQRRRRRLPRHGDKGDDGLPAVAGGRGGRRVGAKERAGRAAGGAAPAATAGLRGPHGRRGRTRRALPAATARLRRAALGHWLVTLIVFHHGRTKLPRIQAVWNVCEHKDRIFNVNIYTYIC